MDAKKSIEESLDLLRNLAGERDAIEHRMGQLHLAVRGLSNLIPDKAEREGYKAVLDRFSVRTGLTDLILLCLNTFDKLLTPKEIRDFVQNYGSEASTQQNLLQSIHTILRRMETTGEVVQEVNKDGDKAFRLPTVTETILAQIGNTGETAENDASRVGGRIENRFPRGLTPEEAESIRQRATQAMERMYGLGPNHLARAIAARKKK
jgi:hypothetical protein